MNRDPLGLGTLLYGMRPNPLHSLTAAAWVVGPLAEREWTLAHADCDLSTFCRNPLHPGPCKGWKKGLGQLAPGALTALEKVRKAKVAERKAAREQARATAAGKLTKRELASPLHAKKSIIKNAEIIQGKAGDAAARRADRVKLTKPEIARYSKIKKAQLDGLAQKYGIQQKLDPTHIAAALETDNSHGRDIAFRATMEASARDMAEQLAKKICQKGDGDCDGKPYEDLQHALEEGFRDAVTHGDDAHLDKLVKDRAAGTLLKPTGHHIYEPTKAKPARPAPAPKGPSAAQQAHAAKVARQQAAAKAITPPAAPASTPAPAGAPAPHAKVAKLTDQQLVNAVKIHGSTTGDGKLAAAELNRRGLDLDGKPKAKAPAAPSAPAVSHANPTPAAPLPPNASPEMKHAHAVANRSAPRAGLAKTQIPAYDKLTKDEYDQLPDATKTQIQKDLDEAEKKLLDPKKIKQVQHLRGYLTGKTDANGKPVASAPTKAAPPTPAAPSAPAAPKVATPPAPAGPHPKQAELDSALKGFNPDLVKMADGLNKGDVAKLDKDSVAKLQDRLSGIANNPGVTANGQALAKDATRVLDKLGLKKQHGLEDEFDHLATTKDDSEFHRLINTYATHPMTPEQRKAYDETLNKIADDQSRPAWQRASAKMNLSDGVFRKAVIGSGSDGLLAAQAANKPQNYPTVYEVQDMAVGLSDRAWDGLPELQQQAVAEQIGVALGKIMPRADSVKREQLATALFPITPVGSNKRERVSLERYDRLNDGASRNAAETLLKQSIQHQLTGGMVNQASERQDALDRIEGKTYSARANMLLNEFHNITSTVDDRLMVAKTTDKATFDELPEAHQSMVTGQLEKVRGNTMLTWEQRAAATTAIHKFAGTDPGAKYADDFTANNVRTATIHKDITPPEYRAVAYTFLDQKRYDSMDPAHQRLVVADAQHVADTAAPNVSSGVRYGVQANIDRLTGADVGRAPKEDLAIAAAKPNPTGIWADSMHRLNAYDRLSTAEYKGLPKAYQDSIKDDIEGELHGSNGALAAKLMKTVDPSWTPPAITTYAVTTNAAPHVQAALDIVYGADPKHKQIGHQLKTYGDVPKTDFDTLQPHEQQTMLADLSYIATTSSSATTKTKAQKLLDRFTPPGTPVGTPGSPAIVPPPNAVPGQTRYPDPKGQQGLLKQAANAGTSGDGFVPTAAGGRIWGKHGAAGLMLRHVDDHGVERFLMVERGPAISDPGKWQFPGGAIDSLESAHEGATRETVEELGLKYSDFANAGVHGHHETVVKLASGKDWKYTSIAATVPTQLKPDLSTHHARAETSDAKWMTRQEIEDLDKKGKLLSPLAKGQLQNNVLSLFPTAGQSVGRPGPIAQRPARATPPTPHKPSTAKNLIPTPADHQKISDLVKGPAARGRFAGKTADERLAVIHEAQGFDRTPTVMTKAQMDALLATGDYIEIWRGVKGIPGKSADDIVEEFRTGPSYGGHGVFGNGYYFAEDKAIADDYARGGWRGGGHGRGAVIRALIPKNANFITHDQVENEQRALFDSSLSRQRFSSTGGRTLHDEGRYASAKGHDSIKVSVRKYRAGGGAGHLATKPVHVVQNRSILIVQGP